MSIRKKSNKRNFLGILILIAVALGLIWYICIKFDITWNLFNKKEINASKEVVENFLDNYSQQNKNSFKYIDYSSKIEHLNFDGFTGKLAKGISYEIKSVSKENNKLIVKVIINNYDMKTIFENLEKENLTNKNDMINYIDSVLESHNPPKKDYECYIPITNDDATYKISITDTLSNGLFGGLNEYIYELSN